MQIIIGVSLVLIFTAFVGTGDFLSGIASRKIGENKAIFWIFFFQTILSAVYWILFNHTFSLTTHFFILALIAGVFQSIGLLFFYRSMTMENISLMTPIFSTYSLLTVFYGIFILHDPLTTTKMFAIISIVLGTILVSTDFSFKKDKINLFQSKGFRTVLLGTVINAFGFLFITIAFKNGNFYFYNVLFALGTFLTTIVFNKSLMKTISLPSKNMLWMILGSYMGQLTFPMHFPYPLFLPLLLRQ